MDYKNKIIKAGELDTFFLDLDGTLLSSKTTLEKDNVLAVNEFSKSVDTVLCSGRYYKGVLPIYNELGLSTPIITLNGAVIFDKGKVVSETHIEKKALEPLLDILELFNERVSINLFCLNKWITNDLNDCYLKEESRIVNVLPDEERKDICFLDNQIVNKLMVIGKPKLIETIYDSIRCIDGLTVIKNHDTYIEVMPSNVNKGNAVKEYCELYKVDIDKTGCIGDSLIDVSMLEACNLKVAVSNATNDVLNLASIIVPSNDDLGVKVFIEEYLEVFKSNI